MNNKTKNILQGTAIVIFVATWIGAMIYMVIKYGIE